MKILHIHPSLKSGGIEAMICALANEMANHGHNVTVCSIYEPSEKDQFWHKLSPSVKKCSLGKHKGENPIVTLYKIWRFLGKNQFDAIHMHGFFFYYLPTIFTKRKHNLFYTVHNDAYQENVLYDAYIVRLKKYAFSQGLIHAITISEQSKASFEELYHCSNRMIVNGTTRPVIKDYCDIINQQHFSSSTKVFLNPARITKQKNQIVLVNVFKRLIDEGYDIALLIAGDMQDKAIYSELTPFFSNRIIYLGTQNDIPNILAHVDALVLPSLWEGLPVSLLEALSVGCIPICSPVGGVINVVKDNFNGILSSDSSELGFYEALMRYLNTGESELKCMKHNCIESFNKYDIKNTAREYIDYYRSIGNS